MAGQHPLRPWQILLLAAAGGGTFHLAFLFPAFCWLVVVYLGGLFALRRVPTSRWAFYTGLGVGIGVSAPELGFFYRIFGPAATVLWLILAFWHGVFLLVLHHVHRRVGSRGALWWAPVLWVGIEYFRSELYYLRFSWLSAGSVLPVEVSGRLLPFLGVYGLGGVLMLIAAGLVFAIEGGKPAVARLGERLKWPMLAAAGLILVALAVGRLTLPDAGRAKSVRVCGLQLEFPGPAELMQHLRRLAQTQPDAEWVVLSEYVFDGPVPDGVKAWCRQNQRWLIAGGKEPLANGGFDNTAYVVNPQGEVVFQQVKAVPIQFFQDGRPAARQALWDSPAGKIGLCVCYDLNYTRVVDRLIRQGARALVVPTMDVESWGPHEHRLNARLAPIRAAEHRVPIFRVASSGISQLLAADGTAIALGSFPGQGEVVAGQLAWHPDSRTTIPLDRYGAPFATATTLGLILWLVWRGWRDRPSRARP